MNENRQNKNLNQQQNNQQQPKNLESQGEQKGAQQIPSSQKDTDVTRK